jgi:hypothetical protein
MLAEGDEAKGRIFWECIAPRVFTYVKTLAEFYFYFIFSYFLMIPVGYHTPRTAKKKGLICGRTDSI